jgi:hypothetical protein
MSKILPTSNYGIYLPHSRTHLNPQHIVNSQITTNSIVVLYILQMKPKPSWISQEGECVLQELIVDLYTKHPEDGLQVIEKQAAADDELVTDASEADAE